MNYCPFVQKGFHFRSYSVERKPWPSPVGCGSTTGEDRAGWYPGRANLLDTMCPKSLRSPGVVPLQCSCKVAEELLAIPPPPLFPLRRKRGGGSVRGRLGLRGQILPLLSPLTPLCWPPTVPRGLYPRSWPRGASLGVPTGVGRLHLGGGLLLGLIRPETRLTGIGSRVAWTLIASSKDLAYVAYNAYVAHSGIQCIRGTQCSLRGCRKHRRCQKDANLSSRIK
jgi:hypothetical protein